jgi:Flp pilus assembly protein TadG
MRARRRRDDRGAAAVEFGLVAILFFTLVFGIIQFGFWLWAWEQSAHAAREAARYAAVYPTCPGTIETKGEEALDGAPVTASNVDVGVAPANVGDPITVTVTADVIDIGFLPSLTPTINKQATSRVENIPAAAVCP